MFSDLLPSKITQGNLEHKYIIYISMKTNIKTCHLTNTNKIRLIFQNKNKS